MDNLNLVDTDAGLKTLRSLFIHDLTLGNFPILYKGSLDHDMMRIFTDLAKKKMIAQGININIVKRTYHILVESLQNISRHSIDSNESTFGNGIFLFTQNEEYLILFTGNLVLKSKKEILEKYINDINAMDKDQLREYRRVKMRDGLWSEKGGAGLGLIDIARKSDEKLEYDFTPADDDKYNLFLLKISIKK